MAISKYRQMLLDIELKNQALRFEPIKLVFTGMGVGAGLTLAIVAILNRLP